MSAFDRVLLFIYIANAVQHAMVGPDTSLAGRQVAAGVLIGWPTVIDRVWRQSRWVARVLAGEGIVLIHRGVVLLEHPRRAGVPQVCSGRCASKASPPPAEVPTLYAPRPTSLNS